MPRSNFGFDNIMSDDVVDISVPRRRQRQLEIGDSSALDISYSWSTGSTVRPTDIRFPSANGKFRKVYEPKGFMAEITRSATQPKLMPSLIEDETRIARSHVPPVIKCQCNGVEAKALVNSASTISTVSKDFARRIKALSDVVSDVGNVSNPLRVPMPYMEGRLQCVELIIGNFQQNLQLYVVTENPADISLGVDFLRKSHGIVNFQESCLVLGGSRGHKVPFLTNSEISMMKRPGQGLI